MVDHTGPYKRITELKVEDEDGQPGSGCPLYVTISLIIWNYPPYTQYAGVPDVEWKEELEWCSYDSPEVEWPNIGAVPDIASVHYALRINEITEVWAYFGDPDNPQNGSWMIDYVGPGATQFNTQVFEVTGAPEDPLVRKDEDITFVWAACNFDHVINSPELPFPPFPWGDPAQPRNRWYTKLDVNVFFYAFKLDPTPYCTWEPWYQPGQQGYIVYKLDESYWHPNEGGWYHEKYVKRPISSFPLNVTYNGMPLQLIATSSNDAKRFRGGYGDEISFYLDLLYKVDYCENPVEEFTVVLYLRQYWEADSTPVYETGPGFVPDDLDPQYNDIMYYDWDYIKQNIVKSVNGNGTAEVAPWTAFVSYFGTNGNNLTLPSHYPKPNVTGGLSYPHVQTHGVLQWQSYTGAPGIQDGGGMSVGPPDGYTGPGGAGYSFPPDVPCMLKFSFLGYTGPEVDYYYLGPSTHRKYRLRMQGIAVPMDFGTILPDQTVEYLGDTYDMVDWTWNSTGFPDEPFYGWYGGRQIRVTYRRRA